MPNLPEQLVKYSDEQLKHLIQLSNKILDNRQKERRRQAIAEIKRIAKAHDLSVDVGAPKPRKKVIDTKR